MVARQFLDVPFDQKDDAKAAGARWDPKARSWYAPQPGMPGLAAWTPLPDTLPGEDRTFGSGLYPDMCPSTTWFTNVRSAVAPGDWERLRKMVYRRAGHRCEACGAGKNPDARRWLEAHERWLYQRAQPSGRLIQRLVRLVCLCTPCHQATHFGHAQLIGHEQDAIEHLCHVNGWSPQQAWEHVDAAFDKWRRRSDHVWELDLSMLTDAGVTVTPPPAAADRPEHAAAGLRASRNERPPRSVGEVGGPARSVGDVGRRHRPERARGEEVEPGVSVRAVTHEELATSDDPMARILRGESPYPR